MVKEEELAKVISICNKNLATAEEILDGCGGVCRAVLGKKRKKQLRDIFHALLLMKLD